MVYSDGTVIDSNYGTTTNPTTAVYYPTLSSSNTTYTGQSTSTKFGFKDTFYDWNKSKIEDTNTQSMLFNGSYWLVSRCIEPESTRAGFYVCNVWSGGAHGFDLCWGRSYGLMDCIRNNCAVRPVVNLKSNVIDVNTDYNIEGEWKLK